MVHVLYYDDTERVLEKIPGGTQSMIVRSAAIREITAVAVELTSVTI